VTAYPLSRGSRAPVAHKEIMDSIKGAIELCEYIEARERDGVRTERLSQPDCNPGNSGSDSCGFSHTQSECYASQRR